MAAQKVRYELLKSVYNRMYFEAEYNTAGILAWTGYTTKLLKSLDIPLSYQTGIFANGLVKMGCVGRRERGSRNTPSVWELGKPPTREEFERIAPNPLTDPLTLAKLEERIKNIEKMIGGANVGTALKAIIERQDDLATRLDKLERS